MKEVFSNIMLLLALFSLAFSAIVLSFQLYRDFFRRRRLKVNCFIERKAHRGSGVDWPKQVRWIVVNTGRGNIEVTALLVKPVGTSSEILVHTAPVPKPLKHGEYFIAGDYIYELFEAFKKFNTEAIESCIARDTLGREWYAPAKDVKSINEAIQEILHPEQFTAAQTG